MRRKSTDVLIFLMPALVYLLVVRIVPLLYTFYLSLSSYNLVLQDRPVFVGLRQYVKLANDPLFFNSLLITIVYTVGVTAAELVLGFGLAVTFNRRIRGERVLIAALLLPMVMVPVVVGTIWYILFNETIGPINYFSALLGIQSRWINGTATALISVMLVDIWEWTPFMFLLILSGLQGIPESVLEASKIDGAGHFQTMTRIKLPLIADIVLVATMFRAMDAVRTFDTIFTLTRGGPGTATELLGYRIYNAAFVGWDMGYASALVVAMLAMLLMLFAFYLRKVRLDF